MFVYDDILGCGKPAFYLKRKPLVGEEVLASDAILLNGNTPKQGDPIICGSCRRPLGAMVLRHNQIREVEDK